MLEALPEFPTTYAKSSRISENNETGVEDGNNEVLCICMSSGTSGAYQSAILAKDYFFEENPESTIKVHVVDSKCMSHGSGWLIMKSAMMREQGASFEEIVTFNENYKKKIKHFLLWMI